jgi:membrane-bound lytic murein transglycosylase D
MRQPTRHTPFTVGLLFLWSIFLWSLLGCGIQRSALEGGVDPAAGGPQLAADSPAAPRAPEEVPAPETAEAETEEATACGVPPSDAAAPPTVSDAASGVQAELDEALGLCRASQERWRDGDMEAALAALDQAYELILAVTPEDDPNLIRQKEEIRFMISKRIMEIYASRHTMVKGKHRPIPMDMNAHVEKEIDALTRGDFFREAYRRSGRYHDMIVAELEKAGLPTELVWLPLIESGFRVKALSPARALGLWQFIPSTGYKFGLKRDRFVDERLDPVKSTHAAIAYLKELHKIFGDWSTVLAAYNCGEGRVLKVIRSQNVNYLDNFWDLYEQLPRETARYVPRFLATLHILQDPKKYGIDLTDVDTPVETETLTVSKRVCLKEVAQKINVPGKTLQRLNPELRQQVLPPGEYALRVPAGKAATLLARLDDIPVFDPAPSRGESRNAAYHRVRRGETLSTIAERYGISMKGLMRANRLHRRDYIVAGKILKIPGVGGGTGAGKRKSHPVHVVQKGDSLWDIARKYGTTTDALGRRNNLSGSALSIGQVLKIPGRGSGRVNPKRLKTYKVRRGDVPMEIAQRHRMSLERFLKVNKMTKHSTIYPGQKVFVD